MAKADKMLRKVFACAVALCLLAVLVVGYLHLHTEHIQKQREAIYRQAVLQVKKEKKARQDEYRRRLARVRAEQHFQNSGALVDLSSQPE